MRSSFYLLKYVIRISLILIPIILVSCKKSSKSSREINEIDSLLKISDHYIDVNFHKSNFYARKAAEKSENVNDSYRKSLSYYYLAKNYSSLRKFDQCHTYIRKGFGEKATLSDPFLNALFISVNANYHSRVGLLQKESEENFKLLKLLENKSDLDSKLLYANSLMAVADNYTEKSNFMLARQFAEKSLKLVESIPEKEYLRSRKILRRKTYLYYYCAVLFLQAKNPDKALFFIKKSYKQVFKEKSRNSGLPLECFGDYYMQKKNYREAVIYYKKTIEIKQQFYQRTYPADTKIAESYFKIGMADSANFYLSRAEKYRNLDLKSNNLDSANAERYLDEEAKEIVRKDNINYAIIVLSTIIVLLAMILYLYNYLTRLKINKSMRISENEIIIKEKQNEIDDLNVKLNESFEELVKLAKENSPYFWIRFQEVHPHYRSKILSLNPNLRTSELTLSAYIYLGFTSKEIAAYTFKAVKTIENNRSNFRKKINLSPDKDLSVFIREYVM